MENFRVGLFLKFWLNLSPEFLIAGFLNGETGVYIVLGPSKEPANMEIRLYLG